MTDKVRLRLYKKYPNIQTALVDWHEGLWELVLEHRENNEKNLFIGMSEKDYRKWANKNDDILKEFDDILTYFLTYMHPYWNPILDKAKQYDKK